MRPSRWWGGHGGPVRCALPLVSLALVATLLVLVPVPPPAAAAPTCTTTWTGGAGRFDTPGSWSAGVVPGPTDVACIDGGATAFTVEVRVPATVAGVVVTGAATLEVQSTFVVDGTAEPSVISNLVVSSGLLAGAGSLTVDQTFRWSSGAIQGSGTPAPELRLLPSVTSATVGPNLLSLNGRSIVVEPGVTVNQTGHIVGSGGRVENHGTWRLGGEVELLLLGSIANDGTIEMVDGVIRNGHAFLGPLTGGGLVVNRSGTTLDLRGAANLGAASELRAERGRIEFASQSTATVFTVAGSLTGEVARVSSGQLVVTGPLSVVRLEVSGGSALFNGAAVSVPQLSVAGSGTLGGSAPITVTQRFDWTGSTVAGSGGTPLTLASTVTSATVGPDLSRLNDRTLVVEPGVTVTQTGAVITATGGGRLENRGTWNVTADVELLVGGGLLNEGTLAKTGGSGATVLGGLSGDGLAVNRAPGSLVLRSAASLGSGSELRSEVGPIEFASQNTATVFAVAGSITGQRLRVSSGQLSTTGPVTVGRIEVTGGAASFDGPAVSVPQLSVTGSGTLGGTAPVTVTEQLQWSDTTLAGSSGTPLTLASTVTSATVGPGLNRLNSRTLVVEPGATVTQTGQVITSGGGRLVNRGTWNIAGDVELIVAGSIENHGTLAKTAGTGSATTAPITNHGVLRSDSGQLSAGSSHPIDGPVPRVVVGNQSTLVSEGEVSPRVHVGNGGRLDPSGPSGRVGVAGAPGDLSVRAITPGNPGGTVVVDVASTAVGGFDRIQVAGTATLGGTIQVRLDPSFVAVPGQRLPIITCAVACTGRFNAEQLPTLAPGLSLAVVYDEDGDATDVELVVSGPPTGADVAVVSLVGTATLEIGEPLNLPLTVVNDGPAAAPVRVTVAVPPSLEVTAVPAGCSEPAPVVCTTADLPAGGSAELAIELVAVSAGGSAMTVAVDPVGALDPDLADNQVVIDVTVTAPSADLSVSVFGTGGVVGMAFPAFVRVVNDGPSASAAVVTVTLPDGVSVVSAPVGCSVAGSTVTCVTGVLTPGAVADLAFGLVGSVAGSSLWAASVAPAGGAVDPDPSDDASSATIELTPASADLGVGVTGPFSVPFGTAATFDVTVTNAGPSAVPVTVTLVVSAGAAISTVPGPCAIDGADPTIARCSIASLSPGGSAVITATASQPAAGTLTMLAGVAAADGTPDPSPPNDADSAEVFVLEAQADLTLGLATSGTPIVGEPLVLGASVVNSGPDTVPATVVIGLPGAFGPGDLPAGCTLAVPELRCTTAPLAAGASVELAFELPAFAAGPVRINGSVAPVPGTGVDPDPSDNDASVLVDVGPREFDLAVATAAPTLVRASEQASLQVVVTNTGPATVASQLEVTLSSGSLLVPPDGCAVQGVGQLVRCDLDPLGPGEELSLSFPASAFAPGDLAWSAVLTPAEPGDLDTTNHTAGATTVVASAIADFTLALGSSGQVMSGLPLAVAAVVLNSGPDPASAEVVIDLGDAFVVTELPAACMSDGAQIRCTTPDIASGDSAEISVLLTPTRPGPATISGTVAFRDGSGEDPDPSDNSAVLELDALPFSYDLSVAIEAPPFVRSGEPATFEVQVSNAGPVAASAVVVVDVGSADPAPDGLPASCAGSISIRCGLGLINAGATVVVAIPVVPDGEGAVGVQAALELFDNADRDSSNNGAFVQSPLADGAIGDLAIDLVGGPEPAVVGRTFPVELRVSNGGPDAVAGRVTLPVPAGIGIVGAPPGCTNSPAEVTCDTSVIAAGSATTFVVDLVATRSGSILLEAAVEPLSGATDPDPNLDLDVLAFDAVEPVADLAVTIGALPSTVAPGGSVTHETTVTNSGTVAVPVSLVLTLDPGSGFDTAPGSCGAVALTPNQLRCSFMAEPGRPVVVLTTATAPASGEVTLRAEVAATDGTPDPDPGNDLAVVSTPVTVIPVVADVSASGVLSAGEVAVGEPFSLDVVVRNLGPDATAVELDVLLGLGGVRAVALPAGCEEGGPGALFCRIPVLDAGGSRSLTVGLVADEVGPARVVVLATPTSGVTDPDPSNDGGELVIDVIEPSRAADLSVAVAAPVRAVIGGTVAADITVTNAGPDAVPASVTVTAGPAGTFASVPGTCSLVDPNQAQCAVPSLAAGSSAVIHTTVSANQLGNLPVTASITAADGTPDPDGTDNSASTTVVVEAPGDAGDAPAVFEDGVAQAWPLLQDWVEAYDLDPFDEQLADPFELPVVTDDLASAFGLRDEVGAQPNPFEGLPDLLDEFLDDLESRGCTVDWVAGGVGGRPDAPTGADLLQVSCERSMATDLQRSASYGGSGYNAERGDEFEGATGGVSTRSETLDLSADLSLGLVMGVDVNGFYLQRQSGLRLDLTAEGAVSATTLIDGEDAGADGVGSAAYSVALAPGGGDRLSLLELSADPYLLLRPEVNGSADLSFETFLAGLTVGWTAEFAVSAAFGGPVTVTSDASLAGSIDFPGTDGPIEVTVAAESGELLVTATQVRPFTFVGFPVSGFAGNLHVDEGRFDGQLTGTLDLAGAGLPPVDLDLAVTSTNLDVTGSTTLPTFTIGDVELTGVTLTADYHAALPDGPLTGSLTIEAESAVLLGGPAGPGALATGLSGTVSADGVVELRADSVSLSLGDGALDVVATDVVLDLGATGAEPLVTAGTASGTIPALADLTVSFTGLTLSADGSLTAASASGSVSGLTERLGLGEILPVTIESVSVVFPDLADLDTFDVTVVGSVDFPAIGAVLPCDATVTIGDLPPITQGAGNVVQLAVAIDALAEGDIRPIDAGPIGLSCTGLEVGEAVVDLAVELGGYQDGVFVPTVAGSVTVTGGLDVISGSATVELAGELVEAPGGSTDLLLSAAFEVDAMLNDAIEAIGARLDLSLGLRADPVDGLSLLDLSLDGTSVDSLRIAVGDLFTLVANDVELHFGGDEAGNLVTFGGTPDAPGLGVEFPAGSPLASWAGEAGLGAGNFAIGTDLVPRLLPGFFVTLDPPDGEQFGLPDFLPLRVDEVAVRFDSLDLASAPPEGLPLDDPAALADITLIVSGGIESSEEWPVSASVEGLEIDLGLLADGQFPITNLDGLTLGMEPTEIIPDVVVGGGLTLGTVDVPGRGAVFYGRISGSFEYGDFGASADIVVTEFGPILIQVGAPAGIPLDPSGLILSSVRGGVEFGRSLPTPASPMDMLGDPAFEVGDPQDLDDEAVIGQIVAGAFAGGEPAPTWDAGITLFLGGTLTHAVAPGILTGDVVLAVNVAGGAVKVFGTGDVQAYGMTFADAAMLFDLSDPIAPVLDFAFVSPQPGSPVGFLMPTATEIELHVDTTGLASGMLAGTRVFFDQLAGGGHAVLASAYAQLNQRLQDRHGTTLAGALALLRSGDVAAALRAGRLMLLELWDLAADVGLPAVQALVDTVGAAVRAGGQAFLAQFDPVVTLEGSMQPLVMGIPFGDPTQSITVSIDKEGLSFGLDTSLADLGQNLGNLVVPHLGGGAVSLMQLGIEDRLSADFELPLSGVLDALLAGGPLPGIDPMGQWGVSLSGGLGLFGFEVGEVSGLLVGPGDAAFVDTVVQRLWEDPGASVDPNRIPLQDEAHYDALIDHGGLLLTYRVMVPRLITDPAAVLTSPDLIPPEDPAQIPAWLDRVARTLGQVDQPLRLQVFVPGLTDQFDPASLASGVPVPLLAGTALRLAYEQIVGHAFVDGTFDGSLLSLPIARGRVSVADGAFAVGGQVPLFGFEGTFLIDTQPRSIRGTIVDFPRVALEMDLSTAQLQQALDELGLAGVFQPGRGAAAHLRVLSPGYDPQSPDPFEQVGGIELDASLDIPGLVDDADFHLAIQADGEVHAHADVDALGVPGATLTDASVDVHLVGRAVTVEVHADTELLGASASVDGILNPDLTGQLAVTFDRPPSQLVGFDISGGFTLTFSRDSRNTLVATLSFNGELGLPSWLTIDGDADGRIAVEGTVDSSGFVDLTFEAENAELLGLGLVNAAFHVRSDRDGTWFDLDADLEMFGGPVSVEGSLAVTAAGPVGSLTVSVGSGHDAVALGPVGLQGSLTISVNRSLITLGFTGTAVMSGLGGLDVHGTLSTNGDFSLAVTEASLSLGGFSVTKRPGASAPPIASLSRVGSTASLGLSARFTFIEGRGFDVTGSLSVSPTQVQGLLDLTVIGAGQIVLGGGWGFGGSMRLAYNHPTFGTSLRIDGTIDIPGILDDLSIVGGFDTNFLGSLTVTVPSGGIRLVGDDAVLRLTGGTMRLNAADSSSAAGIQRVVTVAIDNTTLRVWDNVAVISVQHLEFGSDGHVELDLPGGTFDLDGPSTTNVLLWHYQDFRFEIGPNATFVRLDITGSRLEIKNIATGDDAIQLPNVNLFQPLTFEITLVDSNIELPFFTLTGRLVLRRVAPSGSFELAVLANTAGVPPRLGFLGLGDVHLDAFTIRSNGVIDVNASIDRLGVDPLHLEGTNFRLRAGAGLTNLRLNVVGGRLHLPVGDPIQLGNFDLVASAVDFSEDVTIPANLLNFGPLMRVTEDASLRFTLQEGAFSIEALENLDISALAGSANMRILDGFRVSSDGVVEGTITGSLEVLGFQLAEGTFVMSQRPDGSIEARIPASDPVSIDMGVGTSTASGFFRSNGAVDITVSSSFDLRVLGIGPVGGATVRLRNGGLSGTFSGLACVIIGCAGVTASITSSGTISGVVRIGDATAPFGPWSLFGPGAPPPNQAPFIPAVGNVVATVVRPPSATSAIVDYTPPPVIDDRDTLTASCTPAPGASFPFGPTTVTCSATDSGGLTATRTFVITVVRGEEVSVSGLFPGSEIDWSAGGYPGGVPTTVTFHSDPVVLGTVVADADGVVRFTGRIPSTAEPGLHHLVFEGPDGVGGMRLVSIPVEVLPGDPVIPGLVLEPVPDPVEEGAAVTLTGALVGPAEPLHVTVDWGVSGGSPTVVDLLAGTRALSVTGSYPDDGEYTATVTVEGASGVTASSVPIIVANVSPSVVIDEAGARSLPGGPAFVVRVGQPLALSAGVTDPGADTPTTTWMWDATHVPPLDLAVTADGTHTYATACGYLLSVTATDGEGGLGLDAAAVIVTGDSRRGAMGPAWWWVRYRAASRPSGDPVVLGCRREAAVMMSSVFGEVVPLADDAAAEAVLRGFTSRSVRSALDAHLLAAWLDVGHGGLSLDRSVRLSRHVTRTVAQILAEAERVRLDPGASSIALRTQLERLRDLADDGWGRSDDGRDDDHGDDDHRDDDHRYGR